MTELLPGAENFIPERYTDIGIIDNLRAGILIANAIDTLTDEAVVIKAKDEEVFTKAQWMLGREEAFLRSFDNPQIVKPTDSGRAGSVYYLATEFRPNIPELADHFKNYPNPENIGRLCISALTVLDYVHDLGVTHRDVKTGNILASPDYQATLIDFELAIHADEENDPATRKIEETTAWGKTIVRHRNEGTPEYAAPERIQGNRGDARTDIYAIGIVLFEGLFGRLPFKGKDARETVWKQVYRRIEFTNPDERPVPSKFMDVIERATQKKPEERYASAVEMAEDLERAMAPSQSKAKKLAETFTAARPRYAA